MYGVGGEGGAGYGVVDIDKAGCMDVEVFYTLLGLCGQWFNRCILVDSLGVMHED